jgi:cellulose synthase (UDP-forming)
VLREVPPRPESVRLKPDTTADRPAPVKLRAVAPLKAVPSAAREATGEADTPWDSDATLEFADSLARRIIVRAVASVAIGAFVIYLVYRALFTLNPEAPIFSVLVYLAELHGFLAFFFYVFQLWSLRSRRVPLPPQGLKVDVFITTYDEDVSLLRQTVRGAIRMRYPHRTFVLDDGRREEVRALAEELGCEYLTRPTNEHAKAGNWNNAFKQTDADFIATFDADHVPRSNFLDRTLGFFRDPKVAFVQAPQVYHNLDSVQHRVNWGGKRMHAEQDTFFNLIMPGKDHYNAAFFCGTGAVLRRAALEPYGGILTQTITEDLHTSIVLHSDGWKSAYVHETLVTGLAPMDLKSYALQRLRWAEGNLKVMSHINPLTVRGLTVAQRINYAASLYHWTVALPKLVFYLSPPWMLASGTFPVANFDSRVFTLYLCSIAALGVAYKVISRGTGRLLLDELYNMVSFFTFLRALKRAVLGRAKPSTFAVTPKSGSGEIAIRDVLPHLTLLAVSIAAVAWSAMGLGFGVSDDVFGAGVGAFWTFYNMTLMVMTVHIATRPAQKRQSVRFRAHVAVEARTAGHSVVGLTADVSVHGCTLLWPMPLEAGSTHTVSFHVGSQALERTIIVRKAYGERSRQWHVHGVEFLSQNQNDLDQFHDLIHEVVIPDLFGGLSQDSQLLTRWHALRAQMPRWSSPRARRMRLVVPVRVITEARTFVTVTRDISASGISFSAPLPIPAGTTLDLELTAGSTVVTLGGVAVRGASQGDTPSFGTRLVGVRLDNHAAAASVFEPLRLASAA